MAYCWNCGIPLADNMKFCPNCGAAVVRSQEATTAQPTTAQPAVQSSSAAEPGPVQLEPTVSTGPNPNLTDTARTAARVLSGLVEAPDTTGEFVAGTWGSSAASAVAAAASSIGAAPAAKRKSRLPLVIGSLAAIAAIVALALYVVPLFIPHPFDPNTNLTSPPAASQDAAGDADPASDTPGASSDGASTDAGAVLDEGGSPNASDSSTSPDESGSLSSTDATSSSDVSGDASNASPSAPGDETPQTATPTSGFSTSEWPKLMDFMWLTRETAKGNVPAEATRLTDLGAVTGGWKAYLYDSEMEWLLHASIDVGQSGVDVALDWYYARAGSTSEGYEDNTPTSFYTGTWDSGMLDATGPGRVTISAFWQQDDHQYAAGSLMWADGSKGTLILVRP